MLAMKLSAKRVKVMARFLGERVLRLELATPEDIPAMVDLWFEAFKDPDV